MISAASHRLLLSGNKVPGTTNNINMKNRIFTAVFFLAAIFSFQTVFSQVADSVPKRKSFKVGIFAPLYLDSVFSAAGNFRYKEGMPKFIVPAVDFVNGAQVALDS